VEQIDQDWESVLEEELIEAISAVAGDDVGSLSGDYDVDFLYEFGDEAPHLNLGMS
jgi:hypothetical protein